MLHTVYQKIEYYLQCVKITVNHPMMHLKFCYTLYIVFTFLFTKLLGQESGKGPRGLCVKLPPATLSTAHGGGFTLSLFIAERQAGKLQILIFIIFGLTRPQIKPESVVSVAAICFFLSITKITNRL